MNLIGLPCAPSAGTLTAQILRRWSPSWRSRNIVEDQVGSSRGNQNQLHLDNNDDDTSRKRIQGPVSFSGLYFLTCSRFLRERPEPDGGRPVRPPPPPPDHEEDDAAGSLAAARLGERAASGPRGGRSQHRLLRLRGHGPLLLAGGWPQLQAAEGTRPARRLQDAGEMPSSVTVATASARTNCDKPAYFLPFHLKISSCLHWFHFTWPD